MALKALRLAWLRRLVGRRMDSVENLHRYWMEARPRGGEPDLLVQRTNRSAALARLLADVDKRARLLEVGCGPGRNLAYLWGQGYRRLEGIEINAHAVEVLRDHYPQLVDCPVHLGPAEDVLPSLGTGAYDVVFTMAVIEHIHPQSSTVFDSIARVAVEILAIEPRGHSSQRQHPHNIPTLFQSRGFELVSEVPMSTLPETADDPYLSEDYVAWRFRRPSA